MHKNLLYLDGYYHTAYELQKGFQIGWDIAGIDQSQVEKVISKPWAVDGKNFSERIWGNKQKLIAEVHKELTQNILLGADPQKAIDTIAKKMNNSKHNGGGLFQFCCPEGLFSGFGCGAVPNPGNLGFSYIGDLSGNGRKGKTK